MNKGSVWIGFKTSVFVLFVAIPPAEFGIKGMHEARPYKAKDTGLVRCIGTFLAFGGLAFVICAPDSLPRRYVSNPKCFRILAISAAGGAATSSVRASAGGSRMASWLSSMPGFM